MKNGGVTLKKITVFDSGIGGLSVLENMLNITNGVEYHYIADNKNVPYGNKPCDEILKNTLETLGKFYEKDSDMLVIACNTATKVGLSRLKAKYDSEVYGITPNFTLPKSQGKTRTCLIATNTTIKKYETQLNENKIFHENTEDLASIVENHYFDEIYIKEYLQNLNKICIEKQYDSLILGCTHYSLIYPCFIKYMSKYIKIYDGTKEFAEKICQSLPKNSKVDNQIYWHFTKETEETAMHYQNILKNIKKN